MQSHLAVVPSLETPIPTVGECAEEALEYFTQLVDQSSESTVSELGAVALGLISACDALRQKSPAQTRRQLEPVLPFTTLELILLDQQTGLRSEVVNAISARLLVWAQRSPMYINEVNVDAAEFLAHLRPHLDCQDLRDRATATISKMTH